MSEPNSAALLQTDARCGPPIAAHVSSERSDNGWDDFLRASDLGQFQQSSLWAQARQFDGWHCLRLVLRQGQQPVGGFQLLWRATRFGRIGYIIKGPVLVPEDPELVALTLDWLVRLVHSERLVAVVVQPPDGSQSLSGALMGRGFVTDRLMNVISATCTVSLAGARGEWEKSFGRSKKLQVRQALRRGLIVREGGQDEIPVFFQLMASTCVRQGTPPNPPNEQALQHLVQTFQRAGAARLSFAEVDGQPIACVLDLRFGRRVTAWKKGWNGAHGDRHPNTLLAYESIRWAERQGCACFDFAGMGRSLAEHLLAGKPLTEEQKKARDIFNLEFGARPQLLPPALIYWRYSWLRFFYRQAVRWPGLAAGLSRAAKRLGST